MGWGCSGAKSDSAVIREIAKNQRAASQAVQVSVNMLNVTMFGENHTQHTDTNTSYQLKHGGGKGVIWAHFAATVSGHLAVIEA